MAKSQLIKDLVQNKISLESALLRLKVITSDMGNRELQCWINNEINGYKDDDEIPIYRQHPSYIIRYSGINASFKVTQAPLSESFFDEWVREMVESRSVNLGIANIEHSLESESELVYNLINLAPMVLKNSGGMITCTSIRQIINPISLVDILSSIKYKIIDILIALEKKFGVLDELDVNVSLISSDNLEKLNSSITNCIYYDGKMEEI